MSPEQARGRSGEQDREIWASAASSYEMLAGRPAFAGATVTDTLAAIVEREPDWNGLPHSTPRTISRLLKRCLHKEPRNRLHAIADARLDIEEALSTPEETALPTHPYSLRSRRVLAIAALLLGVGVFGYPCLEPYRPDVACWNDVLRRARELLRSRTRRDGMSVI